MSKQIKNFADEFRYSDPVSSEFTTALEADLSAYIAEVQNAVLEGDTDGIEGLLRKLKETLVERNRICKLNK